MASHRLNFWGGLLLIAAASSAGCLPHGPISAKPILEPLLGPSSDDAASEGGCNRCGRCGHCGLLGGESLRDVLNAEGDGALGVIPPLAQFHPVPTRPVFTPWLVDDAQNPQAQIAWRRATGAAGPNLSPVPITADASADPTPIARRIVPPPATDFEEGPPIRPGSGSPGVSRTSSSTDGWHSVDAQP